MPTTYYGFDRNGNCVALRTAASTTSAPARDLNGGTTVRHSYDTADRLTTGPVVSVATATTASVAPQQSGGDTNTSGGMTALTIADEFGTASLWGVTDGAWVVYDPCWDPVSSHRTRNEAEVVAGSRGCHVLFDPDGTPGVLREENYAHWDDFLKRFDKPEQET